MSLIHNHHWFLQPEVTGTFLSSTGNMEWGAWCEAGTPCSSERASTAEVFLGFLTTTGGCGAWPLHISAPPISLDVAASLHP